MKRRRDEPPRPEAPATRADLERERSTFERRSARETVQQLDDAKLYGEEIAARQAMRRAAADVAWSVTGELPSEPKSGCLLEVLVRFANRILDVALGAAPAAVSGAPSREDLVEAKRVAGDRLVEATQALELARGKDRQAAKAAWSKALAEHQAAFDACNVMSPEDAYRRAIEAEREADRALVEARKRVDYAWYLVCQARARATEPNDPAERAILEEVFRRRAEKLDLAAGDGATKP